MTDPDHLQPTARAVYDELAAAGCALTQAQLEQKLPGSVGPRHNNVSRGIYALLRAGGAHWVDGWAPGRSPDRLIQLGPRPEDSAL